MSDDAIREALAEILSTMPKFPDPGTPNECEAATKDWDEYDWDYTDEFRRPAPPAACGGSSSPRSER